MDKIFGLRRFVTGALLKTVNARIANPRERRRNINLFTRFYLSTRQLVHSFTCQLVHSSTCQLIII